LKRWNRAAWTAICSSLGLGIIFYLSLSLQVNSEALVMPLDDSYIHFQYARQMASGEPYTYNPGDDPTSGATSLLYTPLLAVGHLLGFHELSLSLWAVGWGAFWHLLSAWIIYVLLRGESLFSLTALLLSIAYALSGAFLWAALSGMETALFVFTVLLTLYAFQNHGERETLLAGSLAALVRPEGAVIALGAVLAVVLKNRRLSGWLVFPILAILAQPVLNQGLTGSATASGTLAKSHLYDLTAPLSERLTHIGDNFIRIWTELASGQNPVDGWYLVPLMTLPALFALLLAVLTSWRIRQISPGMLIGLWLLGLSIAIATLDTAFWHFKRYQLPMMALLFPLAGWFIIRLVVDYPRYGITFAGLVLGFALYTNVEFAIRYHDNIYVVEHQQMAMARWARENLPEDAHIAVHDVGVMRYMGDRYTVDVVGLTTQDLALSWRQGPGTLYEALAKLEPDYFAIYPNVQGLPLLVQAGVFGEELARFEIELPSHTVASATGTQVVTQANWPERSDEPLQFEGDWQTGLNVADLESEADYAFEWEPGGIDGFSTYVQNLPYEGCPDCMVLDGGRAVKGEIRFKLPEDTETIVMRVWGASAASLEMGCEGQAIQNRVIPEMPGRWIEVPFLVESAAFCLRSEDVFYPAYFWFGTLDEPFMDEETTTRAVFSDPSGGTFVLQDFEISQTASMLSLKFVWSQPRNLSHDGKLFIHLYDDPSQPPVVGLDEYPGGSLPPANWLPYPWEDFHTLSLEGVPAGEYELYIGFYDPTTGTRYTVEGEGSEEDRLKLESIAIP
jgi:hypothetical protein